MLPSVIGGLLSLLISAFDDLSEFPTPFREAEVYWAKAGIIFCDVIGDQTLDVEQVNAAVELNFALACRKPPNEINFIGCWVDHSCTFSSWMPEGRISNSIGGLAQSAFLLHADQVEHCSFVDHATLNTLCCKFVLHGAVRATSKDAEEADHLGRNLNGHFGLGLAF